ncbi:hypothetical protein OHA18_19510 [Kribbella sp. NBC_00709]|uniref:hypothetical protein n=1 Tax=Kribbella sp. NBC_00709 TaxID=2975972 RepID=UPI002E2C2E5E|nr:hypothetical protein [Kribbella sp. NBC_00709]
MPAPAENVRWWHSFTRNKVVYWAASAHTANAPHLQVSEPPVAFRSAGSYLRSWYGDDNFLLDLRAQPQPAPVRAWLRSTATTRGFPDAGPSSYLTGGSLADWFDVVLHTREVTPTHPLVS